MAVRCAILKYRSGGKTTKHEFKRHNKALDSEIYVLRVPKNKTLKPVDTGSGKKMTSVDVAYAGICQKHFQPDDISNAAARIDDKSSRARLKPKAVPSIFEELVDTDAGTPRTTKLATSGARRTQEAQQLEKLVGEFNAQDSVANINDLHDKILNEKMPSGFR